MSYPAAHYQIRKARGRARDYVCEWCPDQAHAWAYKNDDPCPNALKAREGVYSFDVSKYRPLCRQCHKSYDAAYRRWERMGEIQRQGRVGETISYREVVAARRAEIKALEAESPRIYPSARARQRA